MREFVAAFALEECDFFVAEEVRDVVHGQFGFASGWFGELGGLSAGADGYAEADGDVAEQQARLVAVMVTFMRSARLACSKMWRICRCELESSALSTSGCLTRSAKVMRRAVASGCVFWQMRWKG